METVVIHLLKLLNGFQVDIVTQSLVFSRLVELTHLTGSTLYSDFEKPNIRRNEGSLVPSVGTMIPFFFASHMTVLSVHLKPTVGRPIVLRFSCEKTGTGHHKLAEEAEEPYYI